MLLFALNQSQSFGKAVAKCLGIDLAAHEEREFEDGEHKSRPLENVRGQDVYVLQSLHGEQSASVNDKLVRLLFFLAAMRDHGASRVTAIIPYLAYSRKDRITKPSDPVTTRYIAMLLEAAGADNIVTMDVHNVVAFQNAFRIRTIHLDSRALFASHVREFMPEAPFVVASPDPGGVKRAQLFQETLEVELKKTVRSAYFEKRRSGGIVSGDMMAGNVRGANVIILDDMIVSGGTILRAAKTAMKQGAKEVHAYAGHGLFSNNPKELLTDTILKSIVVTDSVAPLDRLAGMKTDKLQVLSAAGEFAKAIARLHEKKSMDYIIGGTT